VCSLRSVSLTFLRPASIYCLVLSISCGSMKHTMPRFAKVHRPLFIHSSKLEVPVQFRSGVFVSRDLLYPFSFWTHLEKKVFFSVVPLLWLVAGTRCPASTDSDDLTFSRARACAAPRHSIPSTDTHRGYSPRWGAGRRFISNSASKNFPGSMSVQYAASFIANSLNGRNVFFWLSSFHQFFLHKLIWFFDSFFKI